MTQPDTFSFGCLCYGSLFFLTAIIVIGANYKTSFKSDYWMDSVFSIFVCTPLPSLIIYYMIDAMLIF